MKATSNPRPIPPRRSLCRWVCALLILILALTAYLLFQSAYPNGTVHVSTLNGNATIVFESSYGVPYISGSTDRAVAFALGYAHAADRLYDMQLRRAMARGRLAEMFGRDALGMDKFVRALQFGWALERELGGLTNRTRGLLEAYAEGINSYVASAWVKPLEFYALGISFTPWTVADSLTIMKFLSFFLSGGWQLSALRTGLKEILGRGLAERLVPIGPVSSVFPQHSVLSNVLSDPPSRNSSVKSPHPPPAPNSKAKTAAASAPGRRPSGFRGSNSWVVHGSHTQSGAPMLATDPHTDHRIPGELYLACVKYPGKGPKLMGATVAGLPLVVFGRNEHVAWGLTTSMVENMDLYWVNVSADGKRYWHDKTWKDIAVTEETIKIRGETVPVIQQTQRTHHGPVLPFPLDPAVGNMLEYSSSATQCSMTTVAFLSARPTAIAWAGLRGQDRSIEAAFAMNWARDTEEFVAAMKQFDGLAGAFTFATVLRRALTLCNRTKETSASGRRTDWNQGYYPSEESPHTINPAEGFIVSCNNQMNAGNAFNLVGSTVPTTSRALRAGQMLDTILRSGRKITEEDMRKMQTDTVDSFAQIIAPMLARLVRIHRKDFFEPGTKEYNILGELSGMLDDWDFGFRSGAIQPLVFSLFYEELYSRMLNKQLPNRFERNSATHSFFSDYFLGEMISAWDRNESLGSEYCDNEFTANSPARSCAHNLVFSLLHVNDLLVQEMGPGRAAWVWSRRHSLEYPHVPFSEVPVLRWFFHRDVPSPGNRNTLFMASNHYVADGQTYSAGPVFRMVAGMDGINDTRVMGDVGQSGNVLSRDYDSMTTALIQGMYLAYTEHPRGRTLTLVSDSA